MKNIIILTILSLVISVSFSQTKTEEKTFVVVEYMPIYQGCENIKDGNKCQKCTVSKIREYVSTISIPDKLAKKKNQGKIYISFVIDQKGYVTNVKLLRGLGNKLDKIALKHIKKMPKFAKPGFQRGKPVKVKYQIPLVFKF